MEKVNGPNDRNNASDQLQPTKLDRSNADFGYGGHERGNEADDRVARENWPTTRLGSAYRNRIGPAPDCAPGDRAAAAEFLAKVNDAIDQGGWTRGEWNRLYRLRDKWARRAAGVDGRFNLVGNKQTGLTKEQRKQLGPNPLSGVREAIEDGK